ncbi:MAG: glycosyltransferase family 39 protein, partial [Nocardioides sp.]
MRRPDPVGVIVALAAAGIFVAHGFDGELTRDLGLYAYAGQQVADGVPPYVGLMNRSGPLAHLVPGLGAAVARLVGTDDLLGMRALFLVLSIACVWFVYLLGRDLYDSRLAGVVAAGLLVCVPGVISYATNGPREKTTMMLLLAVALLAATRRRWWWAGVAVALTTLTWQPVFFPALVAVAGAAAAAPR